MFFEFRNYTTCIQSDDLEAIELVLTRLLEQEGCRRLPQPPQSLTDEKLRYEAWRLLRELWVVGLFVGAPEWTIVKSRPHELLCRRNRGVRHPRLSQMTRQLGCNAFHWGAYDNYSILLEADTAGRTFVSGLLDLLEEEEKQFYEEPIDKYDYSQFFLLNLPKEIKEVVKPPSPEEEMENERKLNELDKLAEESKKSSEEWLTLTQEERERRLEELRRSPDIEETTIDVQWEMAKLLQGHSRQIDKALGELLGGSPSYWYLKENLFYLAYKEQQQLEADGARLLYFQPAEHYRQLDPLYEIESNY